MKKYESSGVSYVNTFGDKEPEQIGNRKILMLLSMFHVSTPTLVYKHWLNAALYYVFSQERVEAEAYISYLEQLADSFLFDRFIAKSQKNYYEMIYKNNGQPQNLSEEYLNWECLRYKEIANNLVFNYLDYLLWKDHQESNRQDSKISSYEFSFRSSVEHYYPQTPTTGHDELDGKDLHSFGNLCLISHSKNSKLSNYQPIAKKEHYKASKTIDSIKQHLMMEAEKWDKDAIRKHNDKMIAFFKKRLS